MTGGDKLRCIHLNEENASERKEESLGWQLVKHVRAFSLLSYHFEYFMFLVSEPSVIRMLSIIELTPQ